MFLFTSDHVKTRKMFFKIEDYRKMHFISVATKVKYDKDIFVSQRKGFFFFFLDYQLRKISTAILNWDQKLVY